MKKTVENFFKWWLSIHPGNVSIAGKWLDLGKREEEGGFQNVSLI